MPSPWTNARAKLSSPLGLGGPGAMLGAVASFHHSRYQAEFSARKLEADAPRHRWQIRASYDIVCDQQIQVASFSVVSRHYQCAADNNPTETSLPFKLCSNHGNV